MGPQQSGHAGEAARRSVGLTVAMGRGAVSEDVRVPGLGLGLREGESGMNAVIKATFGRPSNTREQCGLGDGS